MQRQLARVISPVALLLALGGCEGSPSLFVDVKTDFAPAEEFTRVRTLVFDPSTDRVVRRGETTVGAGDDYLRGVRTAEFPGLAAGTLRVGVALIDARGGSVAERSVIVGLRGDQVVTVLLTRSCRDVVCPAPGGDASATECLAGRCVPPECVDPTHCVEPECASASDCSFASPCVIPVCEDGVCLAAAGPCPEGEVCDYELGCRPRQEQVDGGPGDAGVGTPRDAGCAVDSECDDGNPCTDDRCGASGCEHAPNSATCSDGVFCNGADTCAGGSCSRHAGDPCAGASACDEASGRCVGCVTSADCPAPIVGAWSSCDYSDLCDESATQTRPRTTYTCVDGSCQASSGSETRACSRSTTGTSCGATTYSDWSACDYADACDESATQTRTRTDSVCRSGTCQRIGAVESRACTRSTRGMTCAPSTYSAWSACTGSPTSCSTAGTQSRDRTDYTCGGGTCNASAPASESRSCVRNTDGNACYSPAACRFGTCSGGTCSAGAACSGRCCEPNICVCSTCACP